MGAANSATVLCQGEHLKEMKKGQARKEAPMPPLMIDNDDEELVSLESTVESEEDDSNRMLQRGVKVRGKRNDLRTLRFGD